MKVVSIVGARPQFIKAAMVSRALGRHRTIKEKILHTGQHFDDNMSEIFFSELEIPLPAYHLNINNLSHGSMTGRMIEAIEKILLREKPDWVIVYGDTNSTLAGALAAAKLHLRIAHVEAGMRSFNRHGPEEINRVLADHLSDLLCCSTKNAVQNLRLEGFRYRASTILLTGDVMYDAALYYSAKAEKQISIDRKIPAMPYALCTLHREENTNDEKRLRNIFSALNELHKQIPVVLPLHPRTKKFLKAQHISVQIPLQEPVGYLEMITLIKNSSLVMTDSGGLQKEAYFFKKFCVTLRDETEWVELLQEGVNTLAGSDKKKIWAAAYHYLSMEFNHSKNLYGDGDAAEKIAAALLV